MVGVVQNGSPHLVGPEFLNVQYAVLVMVCSFEACGVEFAVVKHYEHKVVAFEFSEIFSAPVVVKAQYVAIEPYVASAERAHSALFQ